MGLPVTIAQATGRDPLSHKLHIPEARPRQGTRGNVWEVCVAIARALWDADAPPHIVRAMAEACASVNARFPLQRFYDTAVGESLRQTIIEYHSKDDEAEKPVNLRRPAPDLRRTRDGTLGCVGGMVEREWPIVGRMPHWGDLAERRRSKGFSFLGRNIPDCVPAWSCPATARKPRPRSLARSCL